MSLEGIDWRMPQRSWRPAAAGWASWAMRAADWITLAWQGVDGSGIA